MDRSRRVGCMCAVLVMACAAMMAPILAEGYWIEAESIQPVAPWVFGNAVSGHSGTGYLEYTGQDARSPNGILAYEFNVTQAGTYEVHLRGRRDKGGGTCPSDARDDQCNDLFSKMNNGAWNKTMLKGSWGSWIWESRYIIHEGGKEVSVRPAAYTLSSGKNALYIAGRDSRGMKFDVITIHLQGTTRPSGPTGSVGRLAGGRQASSVPSAARTIVRGSDVQAQLAGVASRFELRGLDGRLVAQRQGAAPGSTVRFANLPAGTYLLRVMREGGGAVISRVVVGR